MTKKCIVCQEKFSNSSEYNFHVFPKNEIFRRMWIESLNLQAEAITKNCTVCSKHFDENSYFKTNSESSRRKLRSDAVPQRIISYINIKNEADELSGENIDYEENESENESTSFSKDENSQPVKLNINNEETKLNEHLGFIKNEPDEILLPETVNGSAENVDINNENNFSLYSVYLGTDINTNSSLNIKTESDPLETDITNNESISNTNSRKRQISSERNKWIRKRVSFINGYRKEYICREDFVSEEAWGRFLNYVTYQNARIFVHNQNAEANNKGKTLNKVVKHLEKEKEPTIGTTEGVEQRDTQTNDDNIASFSSNQSTIPVISMKRSFGNTSAGVSVANGQSSSHDFQTPLPGCSKSESSEISRQSSHDLTVSRSGMSENNFKGVSVNKPIDEDFGEIITDAQVAAINLEAILKLTIEGRAILASYKNSPNSRLRKPTHLSREIVRFEIQKSLSDNDNKNLSKFVMDKRKFLTYTKAIAAIFKCEKRSTYYIPSIKGKYGTTGAKGKLYCTYNYMKRKLRSDNILVDTLKTGEEEEDDDIAPNNAADTEFKLEWLKENVEPFERVNDCWIATFNNRRTLLKNNNLSVNEYFKLFPILASDIGYKLLEEDFVHQFPKKRNAFINNWPSMKLKLIQLLKNCKCKMAIAEDFKLFSILDILDEDNKDAIILHLLPILAQRAFINGSDNQHRILESNKKQRILKKRRATLSESRESFFLVVSNVGDIDTIVEKRNKEYAENNLPLQPLPILIGTLNKIEDAYVVLDNIRYRFKNAIDAIDMTFKICNAVNCHYPPAALNSWLFIQAAGFGIPLDEYNVPQTLHLLIEDFQIH